MVYEVKNASSFSLAKPASGVAGKVAKANSKIESHRGKNPITRPRKMGGSGASISVQDATNDHIEKDKHKHMSSVSIDKASFLDKPKLKRKNSHRGPSRNKSLSSDLREPKPETHPGITFAVRTKRGLGANGKKINQDSFVSVLHFRDSPREHLFGVFDGHGPNGHLVSNFLSSNIAHCLTHQLTQNAAPEIALHLTYKHLFETLLKGPIDITFSGSTAVACLLQDGVLYCANSGDSRAILGVQTDNGDFTFKKLSTDHKPDLPAEKERIERSGGRVDAYQAPNGEKCGPMRVWLPNKNIPGLAMSRCIGDLVAASVGVVWSPGRIE